MTDSIAKKAYDAFDQKGAEQRKEEFMSVFNLMDGKTDKIWEDMVSQKPTTGEEAYLAYLKAHQKHYGGEPYHSSWHLFDYDTWERWNAVAKTIQKESE